MSRGNKQRPRDAAPRMRSLVAADQEGGLTVFPAVSGSLVKDDDRRRDRSEAGSLPSGLRPGVHVQQPVFEIGPCPAPLRERAEDLLQQRKLLVVRGQLGLQRLYAASLGGDAVGDRGHLRRRKGARRRKCAVDRREAPAESAEVPHPLGDRPKLTNEFLNRAGDHTGCALLIVGHRRNPFREARARYHHANVPDRHKLMRTRVGQRPGRPGMRRVVRSATTGGSSVYRMERWCRCRPIVQKTTKSQIARITADVREIKIPFFTKRAVSRFFRQTGRGGWLAPGAL
jgi:hypothetical protein